MSTYKRLIPCIFIHEGKAVKWFHNHEVLSEDVVALAKEYSECDAKELLVFDLSDSDEQHDIAIDLMKKINREIHIPMFAGGNIKRLEDAKKILYAGAKRVVLNSAKSDIQEMIEEVSLRFGKDKIAVSLDASNSNTNVDEMTSKGFKEAPKLELEDGTVMDFKAAVDWLKGQ